MNLYLCGIVTLLWLSQSNGLCIILKFSNQQSPSQVLMVSIEKNTRFYVTGNAAIDYIYIYIALVIL